MPTSMHERPCPLKGYPCFTWNRCQPTAWYGAVEWAAASWRDHADPDASRKE